MPAVNRDLMYQAMIRETKASNPDKPFFLYYAQAAVHAPLHAKDVDIERHADRYRDGWDVLRRRRYERQVELGIVEEGTELAPRNHEPGDDVSAWDDLDDVRPKDFTVHNVVDLLGDHDPWAEQMPEPQALSEALVEEGTAIPVGRVAAMHEGKRRARARRQAGG